MTLTSPVMIADTGCANLASVRFAFARLGVTTVTSAKPEVLQKADRLVLPGVGSANAGMAALNKYGLAEMLENYERPLLGICLGMQLLLKMSKEGDTPCLGRFDGIAEALPPRAGPVPHMGWNTLGIAKKNALLKGINDGDYAYFVHSYAVKPDANTIAVTNYGMAFSSIIHRDNIYGCQFHPERSGSVGARILQNFLGARP